MSTFVVFNLLYFMLLKLPVVDVIMALLCHERQFSNYGVSKKNSNKIDYTLKFCICF